MQRSTSSIQPWRLGREDGVGEQAPRARDLVDGRAGRGDLVVAQEIPGLVVEGRAGQQRHLGVAVDEDLLHVVLELVARERFAPAQRRVPVLLGVLGEVEQPVLLEVVAHEVRLVVDDELPRERLGPLVGRCPASAPRPAPRRTGSRTPRSWRGTPRPCRRCSPGTGGGPSRVGAEIVGQLLDPGLDAAAARGSAAAGCTRRWRRSAWGPAT